MGFSERSPGALLGGSAAGLVAEQDAAACERVCGPDEVMARGCVCRCRATGRPAGSAGCPCGAGKIRCGAACIQPCRASDRCHVAGVCDPGRGACTNPAAPDGAPCDDGDPASSNDVCTGGVCAGIDRCAGVVCSALDECHVAGVCDPATGICSNPNAPDGTSCNDDNACTTGDTCQGGVCAGGGAVTCTPSSPCVTATCDAERGCVETPKPAGTACGDGNACNGDEVCNAAGECVPRTPVSCGPCLRCNLGTGTCEPDQTKVGQACTPAQPNACFASFQCTAVGACAGVNATVCEPLDQCHVAGTCDPATGVCSNPEQPNNTPCDDGNSLTLNDVCTNGVCAGTPVSVCTAGLDLCDGVSGTLSCGTADQFCLCTTTIGGSPVCVSLNGGCVTCANDADCGGAEWACVEQPCCGSGSASACMRRCS